MTDRDTGDGSMSTAATQRAADEHDFSDLGLPALAQHDVGAGSAARIRSRALATLRRREQLAKKPGLAKAWLWYERTVEPTLWIGLGLGYCAWAAAGALAVLH